MIGSTPFSKYFNQLNEKAGFKNHQRQIFFKSHSLRKFFATTLLKNDFPQIKADWLLGHRVDPVTESYFKPSPESLKSDYLKVLPHLTITEKLEVKSITDERLRELEDELAGVRESNAEMKEERAISG